MPVHKTKKPAKKPASKPAAAKPGKNQKPASAKNGRPAKPAPPAPAPPFGAKPQFDAFAKAIQLLHKRNFREAKELFDKTRKGPSPEIASNATLHGRMCERRLAAPLPKPKTAQEHHKHANARIS